MVKRKTATLNLRIDPSVKEAVKAAAEREHRSVANLIEVLIRSHCREHGHPVPEQTSLFWGKDGQ